MAVVSHKLHWNGAVGSWEFGGKRQYAAVYWVKTNDPEDNVVTVNNYMLSEVISFGGHYSYGSDSDFLAFVKSIAPRRIPGSAIHWEVTVTFETMDDGNEENRAQKDENGEPTTNPLEWRDVPSVSNRIVSQPVYRAKYLQNIHLTSEGSYGPVINQAGTLFDPPLEQQVWHEILRIEHYDNYFPNTTEDYLGAVNSQSFFVNYPYAQLTRNWLKYQAMVIGWEGTFQRINDVDVWRWTVDVERNPKGWVREIPNVGTYARALDGDPDGNGEHYSSGGSNPYEAPETGQRQLVDATGRPLTEPIPLNEEGQPLAAGEPVQYLKYLVEEETDFNRLRDIYGLFGEAA